MYIRRYELLMNANIWHFFGIIARLEQYIFYIPTSIYVYIIFGAALCWKWVKMIINNVHGQIRASLFEFKWIRSEHIDSHTRAQSSLCGLWSKYLNRCVCGCGDSANGNYFSNWYTGPKRFCTAGRQLCVCINISSGWHTIAMLPHTSFNFRQIPVKDNHKWAIAFDFME